MENIDIGPLGNYKRAAAKRTVIHVDMDAYFASIEQAENPFLQGKPVIVCGNPETRTVVAACSYEAKKYGVKSGMSLFEALNLCPRAVTVPVNHSKYEATSKKIFENINSIADNMEIASIDEVFIDATDIVKLYKGADNICKEIKARIKKATGLDCSCGAGPNKLIAKIASSLAKPGGIKIIEPCKVDAFMKDLPIEEVPGIGPKMSGNLHDMGISVCSEIQRIGRNFFFERFGTAGKKIYYSACGIDESPVLSRPPEPKSIGSSYTLPFDTLDAETLNRIFFNLCEQVAKRMRSENCHGNYCSVVLRFSDFSEMSRRKKFNDIPADGKKIYLLAKEVLKGVRITKDIRMAGITIGKLFWPDYNYLFPDKRERACSIADKINVRFGENTVVTANMLAGEKKANPHP